MYSGFAMGVRPAPGDTRQRGDTGATTTQCTILLAAERCEQGTQPCGGGCL